MEQPLAADNKVRRHRLLADERRMAIVQALGEGPRQVPELARLLGIHPTTVRSHLERLLEAGVLEEEPGVPAGRGRPSKRYRLREPLLVSDPEVRLFVGGLVSLLRKAYGDDVVAVTEEEGAEQGRSLGRPFRHPSIEQTAREVTGVFERLSFAPTPPVRVSDVLAVDLRHCPFRVEPGDPNGTVVCAFHEGVVRGIAEVTSGGTVTSQVMPFHSPGRCRIELAEGSGPPPGGGSTAKRGGASRRTRRRSG